MKHPFFILLIFSLLGQSYAQQTITESGMTLHYQVQADHLLLTLTAPMTGWVAIGFNETNHIVGSDLKMMGLKHGSSYASDQYVVGVGKHPTDISQGGASDIEVIQAHEAGGQTKMVFRLPLTNADKWDFQHQLNKPFWLILAYSVSDDLDHHSRVRRHVYMSWEHGRL